MKICFKAIEQEKDEFAQQKKSQAMDFVAKLYPNRKIDEFISNPVSKAQENKAPLS